MSNIAWWKIVTSPERNICRLFLKKIFFFQFWIIIVVNKPVPTVRILHRTLTSYLLYDQQERHTKDTMLKIYNIKKTVWRTRTFINSTPCLLTITPKCCETCHNMTAYYYMSYENITNTTSTVHLVQTATSSSVIKKQVLPEWTTSLFTVNINMKIPFFWDKTLRNCVIGSRRFERNLTPSVSRFVASKTNRHIGTRRRGHNATSKRRDLRQSGAASYPKRESSNYTAAKTSKLTS